MLSEGVKKGILELLNKYPNKRSAVMPALDLAQRVNGSLTAEDMREVAEMLDINPVITNEITGFYSMYNVEKPMGRHHIQVCANLPCSLMGADHIVAHLERVLQIKAGQTTHDKKFTLSKVECLGSCGTAPMMQVNDDYYENLTEQKINDILKTLA